MNVLIRIALGLALGCATAGAQQISGGGGGGGGTPGGSSGQFQYDNAGAFGGAEFWRNAAGVFWAANSTTATAVVAYNTTDSNTSPTNYERGTFDWTTTGNTLTIGTQKGGTGTARAVQFVTPGVVNLGFSFANGGSATSFFGPDNGNAGFGIGTAAGQVDAWWAPNVGAGYGWRIRSDAQYAWVSSTAAVNGPDTGFSRTAAGVIDVNQGTRGNHDGWFNYGGQTRVTSDVTFTSTTALATVTGLSVSVAAGRTYHFDAHLSFTDAAAGGIQAAIAGTATATNIIYDGWVVDSAANGVKGNTQATALATAVASSTTTGTAGFVEISGTITVNAAGTLLVQAAQNTSNGTATTIKRGSTFIVQDMP